MSMRSWLRIAVLAAAAAIPCAASAQSAFDQRIAHWRVSGAGSSCVAFNRPAYEVNAAPFNALSVSLNKQGRWNFTVYFWPKAFTPDADIPLVFTFGGTKDVKALGKAADEYVVILGNIGASFRSDVANAQRGQMTVAAEGLTKQLFFDVSDTAAVFGALEACAKTLR